MKGTANSTEKGCGHRAEDVKSAAGALSPEETLRHPTLIAICPGLRSFLPFSLVKATAPSRVDRLHGAFLMLLSVGTAITRLLSSQSLV